MNRLILSFALIFGNAYLWAQDTIYVRYDAAGLNDGSSWQHAYVDLQTALANAQTGDQIWIARGIYTPTDNSDRTKSFELESGISMLGGFTDSTEQWEPSTVSQNLRTLLDFIKEYIEKVEDTIPEIKTLINDIEAEINTIDNTLFENSVTILSGNIGELDDSTDNSYNVLKAINKTGIQLNNLIITDGFADGRNSKYRGGGFYAYQSNFILKNCVFFKNRAGNGGGVYSYQGSIQLSSCSFLGNQTDNEGGGVAIYNSEEDQVNSIPKLIKCNFVANVGLSSRAYGIGLYTRNSSIEISDCYWGANKSDFRGAGFYFAGILTSHLDMANCRFVRNMADSVENGGGVYIFDGNNARIDSCEFERNYAEKGAGVYCSLIPISFSKCSFVKNRAIFNGGGIFSTNCRLQVEKCDFSKNKTSNQGGALYISRGASRIMNCDFTNNRSPSGGAISMLTVPSIVISKSLFTSNRASSPKPNTPEGGALYVNGSRLEINESHFENNWATNVDDVFDSSARGHGGAIHGINESQISITNTLFKQNTAYWGGGINNISNDLLIDRCTFEDNLAFVRGGGINNSFYQLMVENSTFSGNISSRGGGIACARGAQMTIKHATFTKNRAVADFGGGIYISDADAFIENTILGNNSAFAQGKDIYTHSATDLMVSLGHNLIENLANSRLSPLPSDVIGLDPELEELANNGGSTPTHALKSNSPALGAGQPINLTNIQVDQRGYARTISSRNDAIDIGAFEQQHTIVQGPVIQICQSDQKLVNIEEIILIDSTGGAWLATDETVSIILEPTEGIELQYDQLQIVPQGGLKELQFRPINEGKLLEISYVRTYTTEPTSIKIKGLKAKISSSALVGNSYIFRTGGNALQYANDISDSVVHTTIVTVPTLAMDDKICENIDDEMNWIPDSDTGRPLWEWGRVPQNIIPDSLLREVWITDLDSAYQESENAWLYSPCFDLRLMKRASISLDKWTDTESGYDGAVLQYSKDDGASWNTIGSDITGINWYTSRNLVSNPGMQTTLERYGWDGKDSTWVSAFHRLDDIVMDSLIRLRMAFASIDVILPDVNKKGFAFNNVKLCPRNKNILLEYFGEDFSAEEIAENIQRIAPDDIITLNYSFMMDQNAEELARAFYYGASQERNLIFGGNQYIGASSNLPLTTIDTSALRPSEFDIQINTDTNNFIQITSKKRLPDSSQIVIYAVVKNEKDQLQTFVSRPGGISSWSESWNNDPILTILPEDLIKWEVEQIPSNINDYKLLVFVQNYYTKEVYQAAETALSDSLMESIIEEREGVFLNQTQELNIYPNPATSSLFIDFPQEVKFPINIQLYDGMGRSVMEQRLVKPIQSHQLDVSKLINGGYYIRIVGDREVTQRFIMIRR